MLKCLLDGPDADKLVRVVALPGQVTQFHAELLCLRVQQRYRERFGALTTAVKKELPRKRLQVAARPGWASLKRQRQEQLDHATCNEGGPEIRDLEQVTERAAEARKTKKQVDMRKTLEQHVRDMRKQEEADRVPMGEGPNATKLQSHLRDAEKLASKLREVQRQSLATACELPPLPAGTLVIVDSAGADVGLEVLGARVQLWPSSKNECIDVVSAALQAPGVVWLVRSTDAEQKMLLQPGKDLLLAVLALRAAGWAVRCGWIASIASRSWCPQWFPSNAVCRNLLKLFATKIAKECQSQSQQRLQMQQVSRAGGSCGRSGRKCSRLSAMLLATVHELPQTYLAFRTRKTGFVIVSDEYKKSHQAKANRIGTLVTYEHFLLACSGLGFACGRLVHGSKNAKVRYVVGVRLGRVARRYGRREL